MDDLDFGATLKGFSSGQKVLQRYTLKKILGRGGMGVVWLATDEELGRETALKFLPEVVALDRAAIGDLKREVRRAIELAHPHIVKIHDFVTDGRTAAVSMEYVTGQTLSSQRLDEPGQVFSPDKIAPWISQLCAALDYAHHDAEVVHRDLKPTNLMIDARGRLKVLDFGIAASISDSVSRVSNKGSSSGTPVYMSPQQMMGEDAAVTDDVYALGATLFELLTGKPPFHAGNIVLQVQNKAAPLLNERRKTLGLAPVPEEWEQGIAACLAKAPKDRPPSAGEFAQRLGLQTAGLAPRIVPRPAPLVVAASAPAVPPPVVVAPAPAPARPPQISTGELAKKAINFVTLCAVGMNLFFLMSLFALHTESVGDYLSAISSSDLMFYLAFNLISFAVCWLALFVALVLWRAVFGWKAPEAKPPGLPWMRTSLLAAVIPWAALNGWYLIHLLGQPQTSLEAVASGSIGAYSIDAVVFTLLLTVLRAWKRRDFWLFVTFFAGTGGALTTGAYAQGEMFAQMELAGGTLVLSGLAAAVVWGLAGAAAHHLLFKERPSFGPQRSLVLGAIAVAVAVAGYQLFVALPDEVQLAEYRAEQVKKRVETEAKLAEDARLAAESAQNKLEMLQKQKEAETAVRAAYKMVFDQAPDQASLDAYTKSMLADPAYDATRLRHEMRASPQGKQGGRVLVPTEFKTIQNAIYEAIPGNVVLVAAGTYEESIYLQSGITLQGAGSDQVIVQSEATTNTLSIANDATGVKISGFTFRHKARTGADRRYSPVWISGKDVELSDNIIRDGDGHNVTLKGAVNCVVRNNVIFEAGWDGIAVYAGTGGKILENEIKDNQQRGINIVEQPGVLLVANNTLKDNGDGGLLISKGDGVTVADNTAEGNGTKNANGGIGVFVGAGRPVFRGNVARENKGSGIWFDPAKPPVIGLDNVSDGKILPLSR